MQEWDPLIDGCTRSPPGATFFRLRWQQYMAPQWLSWQSG